MWNLIKNKKRIKAEVYLLSIAKVKNRSRKEKTSSVTLLLLVAKVKNRCIRIGLQKIIIQCKPFSRDIRRQTRNLKQH